MKTLLMLGGPGSGKGTQLRLIGEWLNRRGQELYVVGSGDIIRRNAQDKNSPWYELALQSATTGEFVPDEPMLEMHNQHLIENPIPDGAVYAPDGIPRTIAQANAMREELSDRVAIYLDTSLNTCIKRMIERGRHYDLNSKLRNGRIHDFKTKYLHMLNQRFHDAVMVDGNQEPREVFESYEKELQKLLYAPSGN